MVWTLVSSLCAHDKMVKVYGSLWKLIEFRLKLKAWEEKNWNPQCSIIVLYLVDFSPSRTSNARYTHIYVRVCVSWYVHRLKSFVLKVWLWKCKTVFYFNIELAVISRLIHCCFYTNARNKDMPCHDMAWYAFNMLAITHTTQYQIIVVDVCWVVIATDQQHHHHTKETIRKETVNKWPSMIHSDRSTSFKMHFYWSLRWHSVRWLLVVVFGCCWNCKSMCRYEWNSFALTGIVIRKISFEYPLQNW